MNDLRTLQTFFRYNDWADDRLLLAAGPLGDEQLDRAFDMGRGSLRKTLLHIVVAEQVWVQRWQGRSQTPWPDETERVAVATMGERLQQTRRERDGFLATLTDADIDRRVVYRDSLGSLYNADLGDMLLHLCTHSMHHRAQAVNMIRRVGGHAPELDFMYSVRVPATERS